MVAAESWFRRLWKNSRKHEVGPEKVLIGVLAFEVSSFMSKLVHLWQSLSDKHVIRLREEISNSVGIRKLVSEEDEYIVGLICAEIIENLSHVARAVSRLAKKCIDPLLKSFDQAFDDLVKIGADPYGWKYSWKKMGRKVKKMQRFIFVNANLYQEMETLADIEQTLRRMKINGCTDTANFLEYEKKVVWKKREVNHLKDISLWNRTYDYTIYLLVRSIFTIFSRIGHVFGMDLPVDVGTQDSKVLDSDYIQHSQSISVFMGSSRHSIGNSSARYSSGSLKQITSKSGPLSRTNKPIYNLSGPLGNSTAASTTSPISGGRMNFYSGPLEGSTTKSITLPRANKTSFRLWQHLLKSPIFQGKVNNSISNRLSTEGPFKGSMMGENSSPASHCHRKSNDVCSRILKGVYDAYIDAQNFRSKHKMLEAPPETLGAAALALHYANLIILIEKFVASPYLIGHDARDDLYNMLPASVRAALREKLKPYSKSLSSSVYDTILAGEWSQAMAAILDWLAPLAHNTLRWQSESTFEHQNLVSQTKVLLVQTLYFTNLEKTEATITELLVGLNYVWRFGRELDAKSILDCVSDDI